MRGLARKGRIRPKDGPRQHEAVTVVMCCDTDDGGVAHADGKIVLHQTDTGVVAPYAGTPEEPWGAAKGDPAKGETNIASVLPIKHKIVVGISGGAFGVRRHGTACDRNRDERLWRASSKGSDSSSSCWQGDPWKVRGGTSWGRYAAGMPENLFQDGTGHASTRDAAP